MIEAIIAIAVVLLAFFFGKRQGRQQEKVKGYDTTKARIDDVTRADDADVADRLRRHGL